jgi:type VI secretion system protein VasG
VATIDLTMLVAKLNDISRRTLEAAAGNALSRTHYNVEVEHWLLQLVDRDGSDVAHLVRSSGIDPSRVMDKLTASLDHLTTGNGRAPGLSPEIVRVTKDAWLFASIERNQPSIRSGHLLRAALSDETISVRLFAAVPDLRPIVPDLLRHDLDTLITGSDEVLRDNASAVANVTNDLSQAASKRTTTPALDRFTTDLTAAARSGKIDPIIGRDPEIRQVIDILTRRRQNNPILTGEAGVGKTAVVEGLALRIAAGEVPPPLAKISLRTLDLGLLQAGAGVKGEFENRLRAVIDETKSGPVPVILFIDEAHTIIGAGGTPGQGDAANLLKPPLARGDLRVIGATTWVEYKKYFEKDAALSRRFQPVKIGEPSEATAIEMVRGLVASLEDHHRVRILDEAADAAVHLSSRYIQERQLPDKAVSLIDTACARVAMSQAAIPPSVEDRRRRMTAIEAQLRVLRREEISGADHADRIDILSQERLSVETELAALQLRWHEERRLAAELADLRQKAEAAPDQVGLQTQLATAAQTLRQFQGESPMIFPVVDEQAVAEVVENWTGIPAGRMRSDEIETVLNLRQALQRRVVGQDHALEAVSQAIRISRAGLTDPRKPVGVFLMVGTSGVGKTETALALAETLYGGEQHMTVINMSEFKEEHKVSLLMGSPPGYVGYGEGGVLTEAVRRRPHSVLLLDEIEKAHPGVQDVFFQVFDKGSMKDGEGRDIDFRNTVIIMTSNAGTAFIESLFADPATAPDAAVLTEVLRDEMTKHFKPAFLGRVSLVPYFPLNQDTLREIVGLQIARIAERVERRYGASVTVSDAALDVIKARCARSPSGARSIESYLSQTVLPDLSTRFLSRMAEGSPIKQVFIEKAGEDSVICELV